MEILPVVPYSTAAAVPGIVPGQDSFLVKSSISLDILAPGPLTSGEQGTSLKDKD